ncbi:MAG: hypothetical protein CMK09_09265 [Ponticaulis sp.]|nr:hypothetical protein [Ponticaulis sp.]|tara:strand:- start:20419 stop:20856 length:438 start_codon:yes stop_codon:yes gene_type:complete
MADSVHGQCLCGSVAFELSNKIQHVDACHCKMCQHWAGGAFIGVSATDADITFKADSTLTWYNSSAWARRGFCSKCGSSLFYKLINKTDYWAISSGALTLPEGIEMEKEIFVDEKPGYYAFAGDHPRLTREETMAMIKASVEGQS